MGLLPRREDLEEQFPTADAADHLGVGRREPAVERGTDGQGEFDYRAKDRLHGLAEWMHYNSRSIYGCTEAPAEFAAPADTLFTYNPKTKCVYLHLLKYPADNTLTLAGVADKVAYTQFLHDASEILVDHGTDAGAKDLTLKFPADKPPVGSRWLRSSGTIGSEGRWVLERTVGLESRWKETHSSRSAPGTLLILAAAATLHAAELPNTQAMPDNRPLQKPARISPEPSVVIRPTEPAEARSTWRLRKRCLRHRPIRRPGSVSN